MVPDTNDGIVVAAVFSPGEFKLAVYATAQSDNYLQRRPVRIYVIAGNVATLATHGCHDRRQGQKAVAVIAGAAA